MKEAALAKEIIVEEKIHITEIEETIEEEIPLPVRDMFVTKGESDGKDFMNLIKLSYQLSYRVIPSFNPFSLVQKKVPLSPDTECYLRLQTLTSSHSARIKLRLERVRFV